MPYNAYYEIDPTHLSPEELEYELQLRCAYHLENEPKRKKATYVANCLHQEEANERISVLDALSPLQPENDLRLCRNSVNEITSWLRAQPNEEVLKNICWSRLAHLLRRVRRTKPRKPELIDERRSLYHQIADIAKSIRQPAEPELEDDVFLPPTSMDREYHSLAAASNWPIANAFRRELKAYETVGTRFRFSSSSTTTGEPRSQEQFRATISSINSENALNESRQNASRWNSGVNPQVDAPGAAAMANINPMYPNYGRTADVVLFTSSGTPAGPPVNYRPTMPGISVFSDDTLRTLGIHKGNEQAPIYSVASSHSLVHSAPSSSRSEGNPQPAVIVSQMPIVTSRAENVENRYQSMAINTQGHLPSRNPFTSIHPEIPQRPNVPEPPGRVKFSNVLDIYETSDSFRNVEFTPTEHHSLQATAGSTPYRPRGINNPFVYPEAYEQIPAVDRQPEAPRIRPHANAPQGNPRRKSVPIHQWKISFSGDDRGENKTDLPIHDFLEQIDMFRRAEGVTEQELLYQVVHLLTGRARAWYQNVYRFVRNWPEFVAAIKGKFLSPGYQYNLLVELEGRLQKRGESVGAFIDEMELRFRAMPVQLPEEHKIHIIRKNLLPEYTMPIATQQPRTIGQLEEVCRRIESAQTMLSARDTKFDPRKPDKKRESKRLNALEECDSDSEIEVAAVLSAKAKQAAPRRSHPAEKERKPKFEKKANEAQKSEEKRPEPKCFLCGKKGHYARECEETEPYCYRCGKAKYTVSTCPDCQKSKNSHVNLINDEQEDSEQAPAP